MWQTGCPLFFMLLALVKTNLTRKGNGLSLDIKICQISGINEVQVGWGQPVAGDPEWRTHSWGKTVCRRREISLGWESQTSCLREIEDYWKQDACFDFSLQGEKGDGGEYGGGGRSYYKWVWASWRGPDVLSWQLFCIKQSLRVAVWHCMILSAQKASKFMTCDLQELPWEQTTTSFW